MGKIIAVANQKGGVGKTTTNVNLGACLARLGKRVLTVDIDPQGNTTSGLGIEKETLETSVYEVMIDNVPIRQGIVHTMVEEMCIRDRVCNDLAAVGSQASA